MGDIADIVGGGTPSTGNQSYWDGDIDWYAPAEIADQIYANSSQKKITGLGYENLRAAVADLGLDICLYRVTRFCGISDSILSSATGSDRSVRPDHGAHAGIGPGRGDRDLVLRRNCRGNRQSVPADSECDAGDIGGKGELGEHIIRVLQRRDVFAAVPFKLNHSCFTGTPCHEAGNDRVRFYTGFHGVVPAHDPAVERMTGTHSTLYGVIAAGAHVIEVGVTLSDNGLPDKKLGCKCMRHLICIAVILGSPGR